MSNKIRNRTREELNVRKKEFLRICNILDNMGITYFLNTGILLGAIRENDFIKWDWDVEISTFSDDFFNNFEKILKDLKKDGFNIIKKDNRKQSLKIDFNGFYPQEVTKYTVLSWNYSSFKDVYWRKDKIIPSHFLKNFSKIFFLNRKFNVPNNPKEYLRFSYGNWEIPLRTADKDLYTTRNHKKKELFFNIFIKNIINKINYILYKK